MPVNRWACCTGSVPHVGSYSAERRTLNAPPSVTRCVSRDALLSYTHAARNAAVTTVRPAVHERIAHTRRAHTDTPACAPAGRPTLRAVRGGLIRLTDARAPFVPPGACTRAAPAALTAAPTACTTDSAVRGAA